jgi:hypothetical protein
MNRTLRENAGALQMPQVWGVYYDAERDLVLASDMNAGLWILRVTSYNQQPRRAKHGHGVGGPVPRIGHIGGADPPNRGVIKAAHHRRL